jgi:hypothetical protein
VIVPVAAVPAGTPFTLHTTLVLLAYATVAVNVCELPKSTVASVGVGVGVGGAPVPFQIAAQPTDHAPTATRTGSSSAASRTCAAVLPVEIVRPTCGKGRMPLYVQANNQRNH